MEKPHIFSATNENLEVCTSDNEKAVAGWVFKNNKRAGQQPKHYPAQNVCILLFVSTTLYMVLLELLWERNLSIHLKTVFCYPPRRMMPLALENERMPVRKRKRQSVTKNEQLRAKICFGAISHDLRTPLTSISGNASNLLSNGETFDTDTKKQLYTDIYDDSMWLIGLVENLLAVTRIEEGRLNLNISQNLIDDAITEALHHINRKSRNITLPLKMRMSFFLQKWTLTHSSSDYQSCRQCH